MEITKGVEEFVKAGESTLNDNPELQRLLEFYQEKRATGVAIKQSYTLPTLDKLDREFYQSFSQSSRPFPSR